MTPEYVETLLTWLREWRKLPSSFCVFQFLARYDVPWSRFSALMDKHYKLHDEFERTLSWLADRWYNLAMTKNKLPVHQAKLLEYYIKRYDLREWAKDVELKKMLSAEDSQNVAKFVVEEWAKAELEGVFKQAYDKNTSKS